MNRLLRGGLQWAHENAKWLVGAAGVLAIAVLLMGVFVLPSVAAPPPAGTPVSSANWLNRQYLVDNNGTNYWDTNTYDTSMQYVEQSQNPCPNKITFSFNLLNPPEASYIGFFYDDGFYNQWTAKVSVGTQVTTASGQQQCTYNDQSIGIGSIANRRITFYKSEDGNSIINIPSGIAFSKKDPFAGVNRYFRQDQIANSANSCPDMILEHPAYPYVTGQDTSWGKSDIPGSAILFAVVKDSSLGRVSESYKTDSAPNTISSDTCRVKGDAINFSKGGPYNLAAYNDNALDAQFLSSGLDANGNTIRSGNSTDDAWIIFVGTIANLPKDSNGQTVPPGGGSNGGTSSDKVNGQTCKGGAMGWIICPIISVIQTLVDWLRNLMQAMLSVTPLPIDPSKPIYQIWGNIRNFANIAFVLAFFAVIFSQATSIGISNYGIKRILPRLVAVAIATNLSYYICSFLVDAFNVFGVGAYNLVAIVNGGGSGTVTVSNAGGAVLFGLAAAGAAAAMYTAAAVELFPLVAAAFLAMVATFLVLVLRQSLLIILVIISPLAFVAALLPGTESWFRRWGELFIGLLAMYPIMMLIFAATRLLSSILTAVGGSQ